MESINDWVVLSLTGVGIESKDPMRWPGSGLYNIDASQSCYETSGVSSHTAILRPNGSSALRISQKDLEAKLPDQTQAGVFDMRFFGIFRIFTDLSQMPEEPFLGDYIWQEALRRSEWRFKNG